MTGHKNNDNFHLNCIGALTKKREYQFSGHTKVGTAAAAAGRDYSFRESPVIEVEGNRPRGHHINPNTQSKQLQQQDSVWDVSVH